MVTLLRVWTVPPQRTVESRARTQTIEPPTLPPDASQIFAAAKRLAAKNREIRAAQRRLARLADGRSGADSQSRTRSFSRCNQHPSQLFSPLGFSSRRYPPIAAVQAFKACGPRSKIRLKTPASSEMSNPAEGFAEARQLEDIRQPLSAAVEQREKDIRTSASNLAARRLSQSGIEVQNRDGPCLHFDRRCE